MMETIGKLLIFIIPLIAAAFWFWMFQAMSSNPNIPSISNRALAWPPQAKYDWLLAFIFLNIFAAGYYYLTEYRT